MFALGPTFCANIVYVFFSTHFKSYFFFLYKLTSEKNYIKIKKKIKNIYTKFQCSFSCSIFSSSKKIITKKSGIRKNFQGIKKKQLRYYKNKAYPDGILSSFCLFIIFHRRHHIFYLQQNNIST